MTTRSFQMWNSAVLALCLVLLGLTATAGTSDVTINGTHAIFLADRTDITFPDPSKVPEPGTVLSVLVGMGLVSVLRRHKVSAWATG